MPAKDVRFHDDARHKMLEGVKNIVFLESFDEVKTAITIILKKLLS